MKRRIIIVPRTGGIFYHLRAFQYQNNLWASHLDATKRFLKSWNPSATRLVLVGPSGGYSLPFDWLERFEQIFVIEPDFIARKFFVKRAQDQFSRARAIHFSKVPMNFEKPGFLDPFKEPGAGLQNTAVLFCNVLGQVKVKVHARFFLALRETLKDVSWASYHDRFSSQEVRWEAPEGFVASVLPSLALAREGRGEIHEPLASDALAPLKPKRVMYWDWQITPKQVHLIEGMIHE